MDPQANLAEQEDLLTRPIGLTAWTREADRARLAELRNALTDWLRGGGFAPDWTLAPHARIFYAPRFNADAATERRQDGVDHPAPSIRA